MASFSISPDRIHFNSFIICIFPLHPLLSLFLRLFSIPGFYIIRLNWFDRLRLKTINSHVRIIHQGYRSHVRDDFVEIWNFVFQRFNSFIPLEIPSVNYFFPFFFGENGSRLISSVLHFLSLEINRVWKKRRKLNARDKDIKKDYKSKRGIKKEINITLLSKNASQITNHWRKKHWSGNLSWKIVILNTYLLST